MGLSPSIGSVVPTSVVATVKTRDVVTVDLTNTADVAIKGPYTLTLLVSPDGQLDDATPIFNKAENLPTLGAGKSRAMRVAVGTFPLVSNGMYNILAEVTGTIVATANFGASRVDAD